MLYLFDKFVSIETVCRRESMKLWEAIVRNLPPKNADQMPDNPKDWILDYNMKVRGDRNLFRKLAPLDFEGKRRV